jgi:60 kDa SS-A/Ro ribonucleoprotein
MRKTFVNAMGPDKRNPYRTADTLNPEGALAWVMPDEDRVQQMCMVGVMGNTFYATERELVDETTDALFNVASKNPQLLHDCIIKGRQDGFVRTVNIAGLVFLSMTDKNLFKSAFNKVIITGGDLGDFIDMCHRSRGFGRSVKGAINNWLSENMSEFYAIKYRKQITDAIRVARPVPFEGKEQIFNWLFDKPTGELGRTLTSYKAAIECIKENMWDGAIEHINIGRLDYQTLTPYGNPPKEAWAAIAKSMGTMALLKYLDKLDNEGVFTPDNMVWMRERFTVEALKKARVFPFRLYIAYDNIKNMAVKNLLADVLNDYVTKYDWGKWLGSYAICPDISGSMTDEVGKNHVVPATIAGMITGILYKGMSNSIVLPWGTDVVPHKPPRADSVITHIDAIKRAGGGGTNMERPIQYLIDNKIKVDNVIIITDGVDWAGRGWLNSWIPYHKMSPKSNAILIRVDPLGSRPFDKSEAEKHNIFEVFGWNDNVLNFIEHAVLSRKR